MHSDAIAKIAAALREEDPDAGALASLLAQEYGLDRDCSRGLLYAVAERLNAALFPPLADIELVHTERCNLACRYCFEGAHRASRDMPPEVACAAVDLLFRYARDRKTLRIVHFGGEPTLNLAALRASTEHAERLASASGRTLDLHMTSNGVCLTPDLAQYLAGHKVMVLLSIDGLARSHDRFRVDRAGNGTFEDALRALRILKQTQSWVGVKMTVMPANAPDLCGDVAGLHALGVNQFLIGYATGVPWTPLEVETFAGEMNRLRAWYQRARGPGLRIAEFDKPKPKGTFGCHAGRTSIAVSPSGEVSPCARVLALNPGRLISKLGDVYHGLTHLRNRMELNRCLKLRAACEARGIARDYRGGCYALNYEETGGLFVPSELDFRFARLRETASEAAVAAALEGCGAV